MNSRGTPKFPLHGLAQQKQQFLVGQTVIEARGEASWLALMRVAGEERILRLGRGGRSIAQDREVMIVFIEEGPASYRLLNE